MEDHSDHNKDDTDLCQQLFLEESLVSGALKPPEMNGFGNAHTGGTGDTWRWIGHNDTPLSASQSTVLRYKSYLARGK